MYGFRLSTTAPAPWVVQLRWRSGVGCTRGLWASLKISLQLCVLDLALQGRSEPSRGARRAKRNLDVVAAPGGVEKTAVTSKRGMCSGSCLCCAVQAGLASSRLVRDQTWEMCQHRLAYQAVTPAWKRQELGLQGTANDPSATRVSTSHHIQVISWIQPANPDPVSLQLAGYWSLPSPRDAVPQSIGDILASYHPKHTCTAVKPVKRQGAKRHSRKYWTGQNRAYTSQGSQTR